MGRLMEIALFSWSNFGLRNGLQLKGYIRISHRYRDYREVTLYIVYIYMVVNDNLISGNFPLLQQEWE